MSGASSGRGAAPRTPGSHRGVPPGDPPLDSRRCTPPRHAPTGVPSAHPAPSSRSGGDPRDCRASAREAKLWCRSCGRSSSRPARDRVSVPPNVRYRVAIAFSDDDCSASELVGQIREVELEVDPNHRDPGTDNESKERPIQRQRREDGQSDPNATRAHLRTREFEQVSQAPAARPRAGTRPPRRRCP